MEQQNGRVIELEKKVANLEQLLAINNTLNGVLLRQDVQIDALLRYLMEAAAKLTDCEGASVLLWDENTQRLVFAATTTENKASRELVGKAIPLDSIAGTIFQERRVIQVDDAATDPRHYDAVDQSIQFKTHSLLGVPMISKNRVIGVLEVVNKRTMPWTEADHNNLTILAGEAAVAIEVGQLVIDLQQANNELSQLDKLKSDFIAIASHELRTPLGIILGYAGFLQEAEDTSVSAQADKVMEGALQLRRIIESMINLRYLKQKGSDLRKQPIPLEAVLQDLERDTSGLTHAGNYQIVYQVDATNAKILADRSRLIMALTNVMTNALSFSQEGGTITVSGVQVGDEAHIRITDEGIGLQAEHLDRIFDEFFQVEDHMTRHHGGLGIGLSITRALILAHNGRIWAESPGLERGTTIHIALPITNETIV